MVIEKLNSEMLFAMFLRKHQFKLHFFKMGILLTNLRYVYNKYGCYFNKCRNKQILMSNLIKLV